MKKKKTKKKSTPAKEIKGNIVPATLTAGLSLAVKMIVLFSASLTPEECRQLLKFFQAKARREEKLG
jgi:hypothetical protein